MGNVKIESKKDILRLSSFDTSSYENYALTSLVCYCVYLLDEWSLSTSLEDIAVLGFTLFPAKFSMVGWPEYPDITRVNRSVLQMRPKYRNLATSASDKGVFLNDAGVREALSLIKKLGSPDSTITKQSKERNKTVLAERGVGKARGLHPEDAVSSVRKSALFSAYKIGEIEQSEAIDLIGMLGVYDHTPSSEKRKKMKFLIQQATAISDQDVLEFLRVVQKRFQNYLNK